MRARHHRFIAREQFAKGVTYLFLNSPPRFLLNTELISDNTSFL